MSSPGPVIPLTGPGAEAIVPPTVRPDPGRRMEPTPVSASAAGKVILLGEHAVVYGRPAVAAPLSGLRATVAVTPLPTGNPVIIEARNLGCTFPIDDPCPEAAAEPLVATVRNTLAVLGVSLPSLPFRLTISSQVPIARGMGSGTAVATAIVRALCAYLGVSPKPDEVSALVFQTERLLHGTPSGVDNTVVAHERPVYFRRGTEPQVLSVGGTFRFVVADTGIRSQTRDVVEDVQRSWQAQRIQYEGLFDRIGETVRGARQALAEGQAEMLGRLMDENQSLLSDLQVSCAELDRLIGAARSAGALGAKLSGGGRGGVMIALVGEASADTVEAALLRAGATLTVRTSLSPATSEGHGCQRDGSQ